MTTTQTGITTEMRCVTVLGDGAFSREQANHIMATFSNVFIEDDQGSHFRLVVRESLNALIWRAISFEHDAGYWLRKYTNSRGVFEPLNQQLKALTDINEVTMTLTQRRNLMAQILNDLASAIVQRFPENSVVLPADVSEVWAEARRIALIHFGLKGEKAWFSVSQWLTSELELNGNIQA